LHLNVKGILFEENEKVDAKPTISSKIKKVLGI